MLKEYLTRIAEAIRSLLGTTEKINAQDFPEKVNEVHNSAYQSGLATERRKWWNTVTGCGKKTYFLYGFAYMDWTGSIFDCPYRLKPTNATNMFSDITNLEEIPTEALDTSVATGFSYFIGNSSIKKLGIIDMSKCTNSEMCFWQSKIETIEELIFSESTNVRNSMFSECRDLTNLKISGVICTNFTVSVSPLTNDSAKSVINALMDYSGTDKEFAYTLTLKSSVKDALIAEGNTAPNGLTWDEYVQSKKWNW